MSRYKLHPFIMLLLVIALAGGVLAQDDGGLRDLEPRQEACPVTLLSAVPRRITSDTATTLSVIGTNFVQDSTVIFVVGVGVPGIGGLPTTVLNSTLANATLPASIAPGTYEVRIVDERCGPARIRAANPDNTTLIVNAPLPTLEPIPTLGPIELPTPFPGSPSLLARNFSANPPLIPPGGATTLTFEVVNQGNRTAEGVVATLDSGAGFVPAGGQASVTIPNLLPGASATVSLSVVAAGNAEPGPTTVPITISYRDFTGEAYSSKAALGVTIERVTAVPQLSVSGYSFDPDPVQPGQPVTVTVDITNSGADAALQALLRISSEGVLLAGPQGDSFPIGDIPPGGMIRRQLTLTASAEAKVGPQPQGFTVSYLQRGEAKEFTGTLTVNVAPVVKREPVMLLESYTVDKDPLAPGETFNLSVTLKNVGSATAQGILVTFGTVETDTGSGGGSGSGSGTTTTPSTTFAPLGSGGTLFLGDLAADGENSFEQPFIVSGSTTSGIYSLPITLRYQAPDGSTVQNNLRASVVVLAPPSVRINLLNPLPEQVNIGEPLALSFEIINTGTRRLSLTAARAEAENGEVVEGADTALADVASNDQTAYNAVVVPSVEGEVRIVIRFGYKDDLNNDRDIVREYVIAAVEAPPLEPGEPFEPGPFPPEPEVPQQPGSPTDILGRLLLGLLGLGS